MLDGRVLEASQVEYEPFGKTPLKREKRGSDTTRICKVWNLCGSGQPAAAMKTHLAKYIGLIEEERAIAFLTVWRNPLLLR